MITLNQRGFIIFALKPAAAMLGYTLRFDARHACFDNLSNNSTQHGCNVDMELLILFVRYQNISPQSDCNVDMEISAFHSLVFGSQPVRALFTMAEKKSILAVYGPAPS